MSKTQEVVKKEINLMNDQLFKAFFRSIEARKMIASFLSSVTGIDKETLINANYIGGELPKRKKYEKGKSSDVIVLIDDHNRVVVEMNQFDSDNQSEKNTTYLFSNILEANRVRDKKKYPKVILINLDAFNRYYTNVPILIFKIRDQFGHIENEMYTSLHLILANLVDDRYNKDVDEEIVKFSKLLKSKTIEELRENFEGDEEYMSGIDKVEDLISDPNFAGAYDIEERRQEELEDFYDTGYRKGKEAGIAHGMEVGMEVATKKSKVEIAKSMLKDNVEIGTISKYTGLSIKEIEKL